MEVVSPLPLHWKEDGYGDYGQAAGYWLKVRLETHWLGGTHLS